MEGARGHNLSIMCPIDNLTQTPELWEAEVFIIDNKRCDRAFHEKSFYPRVIPLVRKSMICATNYGVDPCYVSFWGLLATLFLRVSPGAWPLFP